MYYLMYTCWSSTRKVRTTMNELSTTKYDLMYTRACRTPQPTTCLIWQIFTITCLIWQFRLCLATSPDPTSAAHWTRRGPVFEGAHKSAAMLIR